MDIISLNEAEGILQKDPALSILHPYPPTKLMFLPDKEGSHLDLLASASDFLRIWKIDSSGVALESLLNPATSPEHASPLTSFDWNDIDMRRIGTSSIDTTCTVWDVERGTVEAQIIAHDREVYDFAWGGAWVFASVSADGSVRIFDLRDKEHSTIVYDNPNEPLTRLSWNRMDPKYIAALPIDSRKPFVLDIRYPAYPCLSLRRHMGSVNAIGWSPHSPRYICTCGDDSQALIWDLAESQEGANQRGTREKSVAVVDPILAYDAGASIQQMQWSSSQPEWISIGFENKAQILRV